MNDFGAGFLCVCLLALCFFAGYIVGSFSVFNDCKNYSASVQGNYRIECKYVGPK